MQSWDTNIPYVPWIGVSWLEGAEAQKTVLALSQKGAQGSWSVFPGNTSCSHSQEQESKSKCGAESQHPLGQHPAVFP